MTLLSWIMMMSYDGELSQFELVTNRLIKLNYCTNIGPLNFLFFTILGERVDKFQQSVSSYITAWHCNSKVMTLIPINETIIITAPFRKRTLKQRVAMRCCNSHIACDEWNIFCFEGKKCSNIFQMSVLFLWSKKKIAFGVVSIHVKAVFDQFLHCIQMDLRDLKTFVAREN